MPIVEFTVEELKALHAVWSHQTVAIGTLVDWSAYDRARQRVLDAGRKALDNSTVRVVELGHG